MIDTAQKLKGTEFKINDNWIGSLLLASLPEKYSPMIMAIEYSAVDMTADKIEIKLMDMEPIGNGSTNTGRAFAGGSRTKSYSSGRTAVNGKKTVQCYKCKQLGHNKNKCPNNNTVEKRTVNGFSPVFLSEQFNKNDWYVDSQASVHLTSRQDCLRNITTKTNIKEISVANNTKVAVSCVGDINITTKANSKLHDITITNAVRVPDSTTNLLSVNKLISNGTIVEFKKDICKIYSKQKVLVATADLANNQQLQATPGITSTQPQPTIETPEPVGAPNQKENTDEHISNPPINDDSDAHEEDQTPEVGLRRSDRKPQPKSDLKSPAKKKYDVSQERLLPAFSVQNRRQDEPWVSHVCCSSCVTQLTCFYMPFAVPIVWKKPKDYCTDFYFCMVKITGITSKTKNSLKYPDISSALRRISHTSELSVSTPSTTWTADLEKDVNADLTEMEAVDEDPDFLKSPTN
ncbi:hypothetical protein ILUMI_24749 [Ignelater luminosus]|uniref:CCHC-type domain-containing protein n=1 Tax=Ignelater luminosus TaxID=2038154 RepID=A0A8K0FYG6_IGNLU|nr:hypothetical protein ILUMI_24749 [Ignelater luminosus]